MAITAFAIGLAVKFGVFSAINDAGYEGAVRALQKVEAKDPTGISKKILVFLESDQDIPEGIQLKSNVEKSNIESLIINSDINIRLLNHDELSSYAPEENADDYDLILMGKPRDILKINNLIMEHTKNIIPLSNDKPMNTVFGRLFEMARKKISKPDNSFTP